MKIQPIDHPADDTGHWGLLYRRICFCSPRCASSGSLSYLFARWELFCSLSELDQLLVVWDKRDRRLLLRGPGFVWVRAFLGVSCRSLLSSVCSCRSSSHMSWIFVNSLGSTFPVPWVRVFLVHNSRRPGLGQQSRGLIGIGSGVGRVSGMAGRRRDDLCSPWSLRDYVRVETWEREGKYRRKYCQEDPSSAVLS